MNTVLALIQFKHSIFQNDFFWGTQLFKFSTKMRILWQFQQSAQSIQAK